MDPTIPDDVIQRARMGECTKEDAMLLVDANPFELFALADELRFDAVGDSVTYVINRNINFTNQCIGTCGFCAFREDNGYRLTPEEIMEKVRAADKDGSTEVCIQGGLLPDVNLDFYLQILGSIKTEFPDMHIHAFSPMEVYYAARQSNIPVKDALVRLKQSGLDTMPGTAAEILSDPISC